MDNLLFFILGFILGGFFLIMILGIFQSRRITQYEQIIEKLRSRNKMLAAEITRISNNSNPKTETCIFCGREIPDGKIICDSCIKNNL